MVALAAGGALGASTATRAELGRPRACRRRPRVRSPSCRSRCRPRGHLRQGRGRHQAGRDQHQHRVQDGGPGAGRRSRSSSARSSSAASSARCPSAIPQRSLGSGVIVDPTGIALTNAHVVEKATEIEVVTLDGGKHKAKVIGVGQEDRPRRAQARRRQGPVQVRPPGRLGPMQVGDWVSGHRLPVRAPGRRSPPASSAPRLGSSARGPSTTSSRPTPPSIPATPGAAREHAGRGRRHQHRDRRRRLGHRLRDPVEHGAEDLHRAPPKGR